MEERPVAPPDERAPGGPFYRFRLFVAGNEPNSVRAKEALSQWCEVHLPGRHETRIVDVYENSQAAIEQNVILVPALVVEAPSPARTIVGSLGEGNRLSAMLGLPGGGAAMSDEGSRRGDPEEQVAGAGAALEALRGGEVDLVVGPDALRVVRLKSQVEENEQLAQEWQAAFDAVSDAVLILDRDLRIVRSNQAAGRLYGCAAEAMVGRPCGEIMASLGEPTSWSLPPLQELQRETLDLQLGERWFEVTLDPILDAENRLAGAVHIASDRTGRKQLEAEREHLLAALEQTDDAVMITAPDGTIQYVNSAFEKVTGYTREESVGQNPRLLRSGRHPDAFYRELWETVSTGRVWKGRMINRRKDGTLLTQESTISPIEDAAGRVVNFVAVQRDITEYLRLSEEKARLEEQFEQAQRLESIGRLAGGIAHDFNNMLSIILGYGESMLEQLRPGDPLRDEAQEIVAAGRRSADLTRQLLAFSRKQTLEPEVLDINELVRDMERMLRRLIGEDIELRLELKDGIGWVLVDRGQMEQVIMNLAVNARDAMPTGGRLLIETATAELDSEYSAKHPGVMPGKHVLLAVTDTGCGMTPEVRSRVFEPFFTTKPKGEGTGLGLATVHGIVNQSRGHIWVYSEPGEGTTFKIYLPEAGQVQAPTVVKVAVVSRGGGEHILLVEDEESLRKIANNILLRLGYRVTLAANGGEALLLVEEKGLRPDLVIADVVMPTMSGKELIDRLRRNHPQIRALFMSGYTNNAIVHHGVLDARVPFIQKPFSIGDLAEKIRQALQAAPPDST